MKGIVQWYDPAKRYGWITPDDGSHDVHVHEAALIWAKLDRLEAGDRVEFDVHIGKRGNPTASNLELIRKGRTA